MRDDDIVWSRWEDVDRVFAQVMKQPARERDAVLTRLCAGEDALRRAVLELLELLALSDADEARGTAPGQHLLRELSAAGAAGGTTRDADGAASVDGDRDALDANERVGRYRILGELGRGGMATVYEAERCDGAYRQRVALKVLRRGLDTDRIIGRFVAERQILSDFAHPNIARLLDGGATSDGRPFLVMEKVDGLPLTAWADARELDARARIELFLQVSAAVQEAHRRLVVHRDLKPSNILVDASGRAKLLDFGIAKILDPRSDEADLTQSGMFLLTRRYASPEQRAGGAVTTSSDVYQLGLVLYELLTGAWPFSDVGRAGPAPTAVPAPLPRALRGDVETILRKALRHDPLERYGSVEDLAGDLRLHLEGRPIRARSAPLTLRARKWIRRNRWALPTAGILVLALAGYVATITVSAQRLERERNEAREQAVRAERIRDFLIAIFESADPFSMRDAAGRSDITVADALTGAARRIRSDLADDPDVQAELFAAIASILENLDRQAEGRPFIEEALAIRHRLGQERTAAYAHELGIYSQIISREQPDSAARLLTDALATLEASSAADDLRRADLLSELFAVQVHGLGMADPTAGERALAIYEAARPQQRQRTATVLGVLSDAYTRLGRHDDAEAAARAALAHYREDLGDDHPFTGIAAGRLAGLLGSQQRFDEAIALYGQSLAVLDSTAGPVHNQTLATRNNLAITLYRAGRTDEAAAIHSEILSARRTLVGSDLDRDVASSLQNLATIRKEQGRLAQADSLAARAHDIYVQTTPAGHYLRAFPLLTRAEILLIAGDDAHAERVAAEALAILEDALPAGHYATAVARCRLGAALMGQQRYPDTRDPVRTALAALRSNERTPAMYVEECAQFERKLAREP